MHPLGQYKEQKILLSSPEELVFMLYDEAIRRLNTAITCIDNGDIEGRWRANAKATDIIHHMLMTLDRENGGEIATNLENLFFYILRRLSEVDAKNSKQAAVDVVHLLTPLARSWRVLAARAAVPDTDKNVDAKPGGAGDATDQTSDFSGPLSDRPSRASSRPHSERDNKDMPPGGRVIVSV